MYKLSIKVISADNSLPAPFGVNIGEDVLPFEPSLTPGVYDRIGLLYALGRTQTEYTDWLAGERGISPIKARGEHSKLKHIFELLKGITSPIDKARESYEEKFRQIREKDGLREALRWAEFEGYVMLEEAKKVEDNISFLVGVTIH